MLAMFLFFVFAIAVMGPIAEWTGWHHTVERKRDAWLDSLSEPMPRECRYREDVVSLPPPIEIQRPSLEILASVDVIVRARLMSVAGGGTKPRYADDPSFGPVSVEIGRAGLLEYTFSIVEYLKGTGADQIVGVASSSSNWTTVEAAAREAACALAMRDARWDGREALLFLMDLPEADRYDIGLFHLEGHVNRWVGAYTRPNLYATSWLPAASSALGASSASDSGRFLLGYPPRTKPLEWIIPNRPAPSFTLTQLKHAIATVDQRTADGG